MDTGANTKLALIKNSGWILLKNPLKASREEVRPGTGREAGLGHAGTSALGHASRPSLARSGADVLSAHGLRRSTQLPVNCASLKEANSTGCPF
jgi:hypothetical protein